MNMDNDGQMIFGDLGGLKLPEICLIGEEKPRKNLTQETCPDRGSNPGPLLDRRACYHLVHSGGQFVFRESARYKVISLYKANFATFRTYETLQKHIFMTVTPR